MPVSDKRASVIWRDFCHYKKGGDSVSDAIIRCDAIVSLLKDREERIERVQTVIAKLTKWMSEVEGKLETQEGNIERVSLAAQSWTFQRAINFIHNLKEAIPTPQPNPEADSPTGLKPR